MIVTGLSGAGKSSALSYLEDMGYEAIDNLPLPMLPDLLDLKKARKKSIAVGVDSRTLGFKASKLLSEAKKVGAQVVFLTSNKRVLQQRFSKTRRRHPLTSSEISLQQAIAQEMDDFAPLYDKSDVVLDTSKLTPVELGQMLANNFAIDTKPKEPQYSVMSFSYAYGVPAHADYVFDVRFLKNPFYDPSLRNKDGRDKNVQKYIEQDQHVVDFISHVKQLLEPLLPRFVEEGKNYVTIAFGCTGGMHRSVYLAETIGKWMKKQVGDVTIHHRERD